MLGGDGEAGGRVLPLVEAQQGEGHRNAAVHHLQCDSFILLSQEEEEK